MSRQYAYVWGTLHDGRAHLWRSLDGYRYITACGKLQAHRGGWKPGGKKKGRVCPECEEVAT